MIARRVGSVLVALLVAAGVLLGLFLVVPSLLGWQRYVIVSGSMTGTYDRGSLVFDEVVPTGALKTGDVITYRPPRGTGPQGLVTHRIVAIARDPHQGRVFRTKGDFNAVADPWTFTLPKGRQARVVAGVPWAGFALASVARREVRMILVGIPAAVIALVALVGLWKDTGSDVEDRAAGAVTVSSS